MSTPMALETCAPTHSAAWVDLLLAPRCLTRAQRLLHKPLNHIFQSIERSKRACRRPATIREAARITTAIGWAGRHRADRIACMESSLAAVLLAGMHRRSVDWCIGARMLPYATHAWIEVDGHRIGEPEHDRPYHLLHRI